MILFCHVSNDYLFRICIDTASLWINEMKDNRNREGKMIKRVNERRERSDAKASCIEQAGERSHYIASHLDSECWTQVNLGRSTMYISIHMYKSIYAEMYMYIMLENACGIHEVKTSVCLWRVRSIAAIARAWIFLFYRASLNTHSRWRLTGALYFDINKF